MENDPLEIEMRKLEALPVPALAKVSFADYESAVRKRLLIADDGIMRLIPASIIANLLSTDPFWLMIIAPPGGTKTELIRGLDLLEYIYPLSDLTPQTFLSGFKGDPKASLLFRLPSPAVITMKDFTTVLTMNNDKRHAILSQLREIFDGSFTKGFGTGETKAWKGKVGFLAGVTPIIDVHHTVYQTLGERFVQYRPVQAESIEISLRSMRNAGDEEGMRGEISRALAGYISSVKIPNGVIEVPDRRFIQIANLAAFCVLGRGGIIRNGYSRELEFAPAPEMPTRLAKQLVTLYSALSLMSGGFTDEDYRLVYKVGMDTLPIKRKQALDILIASNGAVTTESMAIQLDYPVNTIRRVLEDLYSLKLVSRHQHKGFEDEWLLRDSTRWFLMACDPNGSVPEKSERLELLNEGALDLFETINP